MYQNLIIQYLYKAQHVSGDTAPHQEPESGLTASGFAYVEGCWTCSWWTLSGTLYHTYIIPYLYEAQHVSGDTPPIIRSL
jgi:hypothetical protein